MSKQYTDKELEKLWEEFGDIPVIENESGALEIDEDFHIWQKGTSQLEIWHWFDERHSRGLAEGLFDYE